MRILQLCKKFPYPVKDGEALAVTYLSKAMHELGCDISLLAMNTTKHHSNINIHDEALYYFSSIDVVEIDNRVKAKDAFVNLFSNESYHISRFISKAFDDKLIELLQSQSFDIIQLETLYLAPYIGTIREYSDAKVVMRSHNVEHEIWERVTSNATSGPKKIYLSYLTKKLRHYEINKMSDYDLFAAITKRDLNKYIDLGFIGKGINVPIGLDAKDYADDFSAFNNDTLSMSFIGSLDWMPNIEGIKWFLDNIWEYIHHQFPELEFHIAGRNCPDWLLKLNKKNIIVHGEVDSASDFLLQHPIMITPLKSGSGMRVKILEAMALGRVVITTAIGLEGIHASEKQEILIANNKDEFIDAISFYKKNKKKMKEMGKQAKSFISKEFDNHKIADKFNNELKSLIDN